MSHPEYLYYALMFAVALPVAWFFRNRVAALVFAVWTFGQCAYLIGMPEPQTQLVLYVVALVLGMRISTSAACTVAAFLFAPLAFACLAELRHWMTPAEAWWSIYWIAITQALALPFCPDWHSIIERRRAARREREGGGMYLVAYR